MIKRLQRLRGLPILAQPLGLLDRYSAAPRLSRLLPYSGLTGLLWTHWPALDFMVPGGLGRYTSAVSTGF